MNTIETITVVGVGYIGLPTCVVLAEAGFQVCGFDIQQKVVDTLNAGTIHIDEPGLQDAFTAVHDAGRLNFSTTVQPADAFYISVSTPLVCDGGDPHANLNYVWMAVDSIAAVLRPGNLVILESTVPPGTTRRIGEMLADKSGLAPDSFYVAHCPERVIPGSMLRELRENDRLVGSPNAEGRALARSIYERVLKGGQVRETDDVTAETSKLVENAYRDVNIAFANELSVLCEKLDINVNELIELANCHPRVNIHTPGVGVGGHCIPVVPWFLCSLYPGETALMRAARGVNDAKPGWVADQVERAVAKDQTVCVLGLAYKNDVDDLRDSPSIDFANELIARGYNVICCEPNAPVGEVRGLTNVSLDDALAQSDYLIITLAHKEFRARKTEIAAKPHFDCVGMLYKM